jgi:hypothetical protein
MNASLLPFPIAGTHPIGYRKDVTRVSCQHGCKSVHGLGMLQLAVET